MNVLIEQNSQFGLVVSSRTIAKELEKRHSDVLKALENILDSTNENIRSLIILGNYKDKKGEIRKEYLLTKDGFVLYMFNIQGYQEFKIAYIKKFNEMENNIKMLKESKYKELENLQINSMKDFKFLYSSNECSLMLLSRITEEIQKIEKSLRMISSFKTHIYFYNNQVNELLNKLQISLNKV